MSGFLYLSHLTLKDLKAVFYRIEWPECLILCEGVCRGYDQFEPEEIRLLVQL